MALAPDPSPHLANDGLESPHSLGKPRRRKTKVKSSMSDVSRLSSAVDSRTEHFVKAQTDARHRRDSVALSEARSILEDVEQHPIRDDMSAVSTEARPQRDMLQDITVANESPLQKSVSWLLKQSGSSYFLIFTVFCSMYFLKTAMGPARQDIRSSCNFGEREQLWWMAFTEKVKVSRWYSLSVDKVSPCSNYHRIPPLSAFYHYILVLMKSPSKINSLARSFTAPFLIKSLSYASAVWCWTKSWNYTAHDDSKTAKVVGAVILLMQPALLLIDDSQLNSKQITLALLLFCIFSIQVDRDVQCSFILALMVSFDRLGVNVLPTFLVYLLGKSIWLGGKQGLTLFARIMGVFIATTLFMALPFLQSFNLTFDHIRQIFGLMAKSNLSVRSTAPFFNQINVLPAALSAWTYFTFLFSCSFFLWHPTIFKAGPTGSSDDVYDEKATQKSFPLSRMFLHSLLATGSSIYLHSSMVEDLTILLPILPATVLVATSQPGLPSKDWEWGVFICNIGVFSLWPAMKRSGLSMQYSAGLLLWNYAIGYNPVKIEGSFIRVISMITYALIALLHWMEIVAITEHTAIFESINFAVSSVVLLLCTLWAMQRQVDEWWAAGGLGTKRMRNSKSNDVQKKYTSAKNHTSLHPRPSQRTTSKISSTLNNADVRKQKRASSYGHHYAASDRVPSSLQIPRDGSRTPPALSPTLPQMIASSISNPSTPIDKKYKRHSVIPPLPQIPPPFQSDISDNITPASSGPIPRNNFQSVSPTISRVDAERNLTAANVKKSRRISSMSYDPSYYRSME